MDRILRSQRSGAEQEGLTQIQKWLNPNSKMGHMNFLPGGGWGKRIFPRKIKVSPGVCLTAKTCVYHTPPRLYSIRGQKNFLTKKMPMPSRLFKNF